MTHAFGQTFLMPFAMTSNIGIVLSARTTPPGPVVSPTDWYMPYFSGACTSLFISLNVAGSIDIITKSAPLSAPSSVSPTLYSQCDTAPST